jgi:hypothetical protein
MFGQALFAACYFAGVLCTTITVPIGPVLGFIAEEGEDSPA